MNVKSRLQGVLFTLGLLVACGGWAAFPPITPWYATVAAGLGTALMGATAAWHGRSE